MEKKFATVGVSARHVHVTKEDLKKLFGAEAALHPMKDLSQPGQFAAEERVDLVGPKGTLTARILGPERPETQVEISISDSFALGVKAVVRNSGDTLGTPGIILRGPAGEVTLDHGAIVASRHLHMNTKDGEAWNIKDGDLLSVKIDSSRPIVLQNVLARVGSTHALDLHIDTDEANAAAIKSGDQVEIILCNC